MSSPIHTRIADALARLSALQRYEENQQSRNAGLSPLQARALVTIRRRSSVRLGALANELLVTEGTLSAAVSALEEKGLVVKRSDPAEHRAVNLELTRKGTTASRHAERWAGDQIEPAMSELDEGEASTLLKSLLKLLRAFERQGAIAEARMCFSCRHFVPKGGSGTRRHYCGLLEQAIGEIDLQVECPDHEPASPEQLEATRGRI